MDFHGKKSKLFIIYVVMDVRVKISRFSCASIFSMIKTLKLQKNRKNYCKKISFWHEKNTSYRSIYYPPEILFSITSVGLVLVLEDPSSKAVFLSLLVFSSHCSFLFFFGFDCPPDKGSYPVPTFWRLENARYYVVF